MRPPAAIAVAILASVGVGVVAFKREDVESASLDRQGQGGPAGVAGDPDPLAPTVPLVAGSPADGQGAGLMGSPLQNRRPLSDGAGPAPSGWGGLEAYLPAPPDSGQVAKLDAVHREMVTRLMEPEPAGNADPGAAAPESPGGEGGGSGPARGGGIAGGRRPGGPGAGGGSNADLAEAAAARPPAICFAPGTDPAVMNALWGAAAQGFVNRVGMDDALTTMAFQLGNRWTSTARTSGGFPLNRLRTGDPVVLTWGFVPDGTQIPGGSQGSGEEAGPSDLISWLNSNWGTHPTSDEPDDQPWFSLFESVFQRWGDLCGIQYVYEPDDDGATFPNSSGSLGVRPDVRIGGHFIDGSAGTLAYNFFPNGGDMILDTGDSYLTSKSNNSIRLRNTIAHEHGHGIGIEHVCPADGTKLMEPRLTTSFDGPQLDDRFSANRLYGDRYEDENGDGSSDDNDSTGDANNLGTLPFGTTAIEYASIDDDGDEDYFRFALPSGDALLRITVTPQGSAYNEGAQSGSDCPSGAPFNALAVHDLDLALLSSTGSSTLATADATAAGSAESIGPGAFAGATTGLNLRVDGSSADNAQLYRIEFQVSPASLPVASVADASAAEGTGRVRFTVSLDRSPTLEAVLDYGSGADTATEGTDFTPVSGTLTFAPGETSKVVDVPVSDDALDEDDETIAFAIGLPSNAELGRAFATGTVLDDDQPPFLLITPADADEPGGSIRFGVALSEPSGRTVRFDWSAGGGSATSGADFTPASGTVTVAPGNVVAGGGSQLVVATIDDDEPEPNESVALTLTNALNVTLPGSPPSAAIRDDDAAGLLSATLTASVDDDQSTTRLRWSAAPGRTYLIEFSDELQDWFPVEPGGTFVPDSQDAEFPVPIGVPGAPPHRYFRVIDPGQAGGAENEGS